MLGTVNLKCCVRFHGLPGRQRKFFESMDIFESVGLSFTRRGTNTGRIQSVFDKTPVRIRISYTQTWNENEHHGLLTPFWLSPPQRSPSLCRALGILRLLLIYWGTQLKPLWRREAFLYGVYFFRKTLFHLDDRTISSDSSYML